MQTATTTARRATAEPLPAPRRTTGTGTVPAMVLDAAERYAGAAALRWKRDGAWRELSYAELGARALGIARGLAALGVEPGDRVAILAQTRPEWTLADLGALCAGAVVVPIYPTAPAEDCRHVLAHSGARVAICETQEQVERVRSLESTAVELVVSIEPTDALSLAQLGERGEGMDAGAARERALAVAPEDLCTIVYTSGTTGSPKGCMLTHRNVRANSDMCASAVDVGDGAVIFAFLPLAHSMTRVVSMYTLDQGHTLAFWTGDMARVMQDIAECRPTDLPSVPRLFEKIHAAATSVEGPRAALLRWAVERGRAARARERAGVRPGPGARAAHALADRLVLRRVRDLFGGRLRMVFSGGAPIAREVLELFDACGLTVLEGYGLTETTAAATMNTREAVRFGTVGQPLAGCRVRIAADGEVEIAGPHVFAGYYRDPEATGAALRDGWLATGDLGSLDADGYLTVTGRKKELIVTASGKNVAPLRIEQALARRAPIGQAVVVGDRRPYLGALVALDPEALPALARSADAPADHAALARHPAVVEQVGRAIAEANAGFSRPEQVRRYVVLPRPLSGEHGELTPTLKVRREAVARLHGEQVEALYDGSAPAVPS